MGPQLIFDRLNDVESLEIAALLQAALKAFTASGVMAEVQRCGIVRQKDKTGDDGCSRETSGRTFNRHYTKRKRR